MMFLRLLRRHGPYLVFVLAATFVVHDHAAYGQFQNCVQKCKVYGCYKSVGVCYTFDPYHAEDIIWTASPSLLPDWRLELANGMTRRHCFECTPMCANQNTLVDAGIPQPWPNPDLSTCADCHDPQVRDRWNCFPPPPKGGGA